MNQHKCLSPYRKYNVVYSCNGILFVNKKDWRTDTFYNINEPWKHFTKWKKTDIKGHALYDSIPMKFLIGRSTETESSLSGCLEQRGCWNSIEKAKKYAVSF